MLCEKCHGTGWVDHPLGIGPKDAILWLKDVLQIACDQCEGTGHLDCSAGSARHGQLEDVK